MIGLIKELFKNQTLKNQDFDVNLLYKAIYNQFSVNNLVVWQDGKAETFVNEGFRGNAVVYSIVKKISEKDSEPPLIAYNGSGKKVRKIKTKDKRTEIAINSNIRKKELQELESGDLYDILKRPNSFQSQSEFIKEGSSWFRLTGEAFCYGVRIGGANLEEARGSGLRDGIKFKELFWLPVHLVEIVQGDMFSPIKGYKLRIGDQTIIFPASEVMHIKSFNPNWDLQGSQLRGQSPLLAGIKYLQKNNEAVASLYRSLQNEGAKGFVSPYPVNEPDKWITQDQVLTLKEYIQNQWSGSVNKNKIGVSSLPLQYHQLALSPVALDIVKGLEYDDKKISNLWGVNPAIFSPESKYENLENAKKQLVVDVCIPFLQQLEQELSNFLLPAFQGEADYLEFDKTAYSEMQMDSKMIMETYWKGGLASLNECRNWLGLDEIDADYARSIWVDSGRIPIEEAFMGVEADFRGVV